MKAQMIEMVSKFQMGSWKGKEPMEVDEESVEYLSDKEDIKDE